MIGINYKLADDDCPLEKEEEEEETKNADEWKSKGEAYIVHTVYRPTKDERKIVYKMFFLFIL